MGLTGKRDRSDIQRYSMQYTAALLTLVGLSYESVRFDSVPVTGDSSACCFKI